jgi:sec-independent protein translocase protein TatA
MIRRSKNHGCAGGAPQRGSNMGTFSIWHWLIVLAVVLVLFGGGGKVSRLMGDFGKGLKNFKKSMSEDEEASEEQREIETDATPKSQVTEAEKDKAANG